MVRIDTSGSNEIKFFLDGLNFDGSDTQDVLDSIGQSMVVNTQSRIKDEVAPDGTPWARSLRAQKDGGTTLRDTGRLFNSLTHSVGTNFVEVGASVAYAPVLHYGATIKAKNSDYLKFKTAYGWVQVKSVTIPARPILGISEQDEADINRILTNHIERT